MNPDVERALLIGIMRAYVQLAHAGWPSLHPDMPQRIAHWPRLSPAELRADLNHYLAESARAEGEVRIYWKLGPGLTYAGANAHFLADVGARDVGEILGLDDFNPVFPWGAGYAARYRADDEHVLRTGELMNVVEQQQVGLALSWSRVGRTPIRTPDGAIRGLFGMYQRLNPEVGRRLYYAQAGREAARAV